MSHHQLLDATSDLKQEITFLKKSVREKELMLSLSADISRVKAKNELMQLIREKFQKLFYFSHCTIVTCLQDNFINQLTDSNGPLLFDLEKQTSRFDAPGFMLTNDREEFKELMAVALRTTDQKPMGVLCFYSDKKGSFDQQTRNLIQGVTYQITTAMANILHDKEIRRRDKENEILIDISNAISSISDKRNLIHVIKQKLRFSLNFSDICISQYNLEKGTYTIFARDNEKTSQHPDFERVVSVEFPVADGMHNVTLASDHAVVFPYDILAAMGMPHIDFILIAGIREAACMRLKNNDEIVGALVLLSEKDNSFPFDDLTLIERVSHHLAAGVCSMIANEELKRKEHEKALLLHEKSQLLSFSSDITSVRAKDELSLIIYQRLREMIYYDEFVIALMNDAGTRHYPYLHVFADNSKVHPDYEKMATDHFPVQDGFYDRVLTWNEPQVFNLEMLVRSGNVPEYLQFDYDNGIREIVGVPLRDGNKTLGAFFILLQQHGKWDQPELRLVLGISYQLSIAIANLLAHARIEQQLAEINKYKQQLEEEKFYLQEEAGLGYSYNDIIGSTSRMQKVFHLLSQVSFTNTTVLLLGETGTGKELIARAIHNSSSRKNKMMVKVNCAAIPGNLIESELFGHERGSFTGATERRLGKFELANHGTLFLDEIGDMTPDLQVKLLRAIQEREIERVGGKATIKVDVRIIAATNRNLQKEVDEGRFRSDLYYRLNVFPITLPPLREHKEDIPALASHFLEKFARNNGKKVIQISGNAMKELMTYSWPGNVRELEHLIERSILMSTGNTIREMHLPKLKGEDSKSFFKPVYQKTFEENERDYIIEVLNSCNGKIFGSGGAAEILNLKVGTLNSKIRKLGIKKENTIFKKG